ncbi:MAG TPA: branched-chain amino acid ABC transporter permease [Candidatus Baltobacteraceae bacterium]|nr:branched-chain amino acid ABC transporter permease [Candidatus Baltobacteraceae bacterium]
MEAAPREANGGSFHRPLPEAAAIHVPIAEIADQLVNGLTLGMLYILVALGLNIILGLMGVINFSHGAFFMLGAYLMYQLDGPLGFWPAILCAAIIVGLLGMAFESSLIRPLYRRIPEYTLLLTFGTALIFAQIVRRVWGDDSVRVSTPSYMPDTVALGSYQLPFYKDVLLVGLTVVILALVWLLLNKTNIGMIIRAGTRDAEMVKILGINMPLMFTLVFGIGSLMAGLAGALAAPIYAIQPQLASQWIVLTFVIVIVGGIGSFWGAIVGGLLIGVISSLMSLVWPPAVELTGYVIMGVILLIRPRGLFGVEGLFE